MNKSALVTAMTAALALSVLTPAAADAPSATIEGSVGETVTDSSSLRLRYVGDPAPDGYTGSYQRGERILTESPEDGPVTMSGTIDVSGMAENGQTAIVGLHDAEALRNGASGHKQDVGIYVTYRTVNGGYYDIGVSDGDADGGEWIQRFQRITTAAADDGVFQVHFVVDGTADPADCASTAADVATADGCMTLTIDGGAPITDSCGTIAPAGADVELGEGAHPGWYAAWTTTGPEIGLLYDLTVTPVVVEAPKTADDCRDDGFAAYEFKNQGQCVASVQANERAGD